MCLIAVATNRPDWTFVSCLKTKRNLLGCLWLMKNVVVRAFVVSLEVIRTQMGAQIVVKTLVIDVESPSGVLRIAVMEVSHV